MKKLIFTLVIPALTAFCGFAQCLQYPISLEQRAQNSALILEGKIIARTPFWNKEHTHILTSNRLEVYKILKNDAAVPALFDFISPGGIIGDEGEIVTPSLQTRLNEYGIFFLEQDKNGYYVPYAGQQGFIYMDASGTAHDVFTSYGNPEKEVYSLLRSYYGDILFITTIIFRPS